jgi:dCMP deaminase
MPTPTAHTPHTAQHQRWLRHAQRVAKRSPHPTVQVGAVVVTPDGTQRLGAGANAPPDGIRLTAARMRHGEKSLWFMCAEKRALALAQQQKAKLGLKSLRGCRIYSTLAPCHTCAHDIIQAGIKLVCVPAGALANYPKLKKKYRHSMAAAATMLAEAKIKAIES